MVLRRTMSDSAEDPGITTPTIKTGDLVCGTPGRMDGVVGRVESVNDESQSALVRFAASDQDVHIELPLAVLVRVREGKPPTSENQPRRASLDSDVEATETVTS